MGVVWKYLTNPLVLMFELIGVTVLILDQSSRTIVAVCAGAFVFYVLFPLLLMLEKRHPEIADVISIILGWSW